MRNTTCLTDYTLLALNTGTCINGLWQRAGDLYYSAGQHREPIQMPWGIGWRSCWLPSKQRKISFEVSEKNEGEWTRNVQISSRKKSLAVGEACVAIFWPVPGFKGTTFEFGVLNRWVFNICVWSAALQWLILEVKKESSDKISKPPQSLYYPRSPDTRNFGNSVRKK